MKSTIALSCLTLAFGIAADPILNVRKPTLVERDVPTITNILLAVGSGISTLDAAVNAFTGSASAIDSASSGLQTTIDNGATTVPGSGNLTLNQAVALAAPVQVLQGVGKTLVSDLIAQRSAFEANGLCEDIRTQVTDIQTASNALIGAIVALVPSTAQALAASLVAPFEATLASGVSAFASGNCTDAVVSSSSTTSSSATSSSSSSTVSSSVVTTFSTSLSASSSSGVSSTISASLSSTTSGSITTSSALSSSTASSNSNTTSSSTINSNSTALGVATSTGGAVVTSGPSNANGTIAASGTTGVTKSSSTPFTGAAVVNYAANSFGIVALAVAVLML